MTGIYNEVIVQLVQKNYFEELFLKSYQVFRLNKHLCIGGRAYGNAHFGAGSGPIFLDDVQCSSSASQLLECPSRPILSHNCLHSADAGVGCEGMFHKCCINGSLIYCRYLFLSAVYL